MCGGACSPKRHQALLMSHHCCRVHFPRLECRTDATHVVRCALGTGVRALNWCLAASAGFSALCLAAGISRSALICRMLEVRLQLSCRRGIMPWVCLGLLASQSDESICSSLCWSIADATRPSWFTTWAAWRASSQQA